MIPNGTTCEGDNTLLYLARTVQGRIQGLMADPTSVRTRTLVILLRTRGRARMTPKYGLPNGPFWGPSGRPGYLPSRFTMILPYIWMVAWPGAPGPKWPNRGCHTRGSLVRMHAHMVLP